MKHTTHRDQIHFDIDYDPMSVAIFNTAQMQRLGRIYQLGYTHLVYRGGTHTRFSHSLGVAGVAEILVNELKNNYKKSTSDGNLPEGCILPNKFLPNSESGFKHVNSEELRWECLKYFVKWAGLLHDIGHIPLGHTLEDEFSGLYEKHDSIESPRMSFIWDEISIGFKSPLKQILMDETLRPECFTSLRISGQTIWEIVLLICLYKPGHEKETKNEKIKFTELYFSLLKNHNGKMFHRYMTDIVSDTICADYMDYLNRDTANVGLDTISDMRIFKSYFIGEDHMIPCSYRMALSLVDRSGKPKNSIYNTVKSIVQHRFQLAELIYYHKTKVSASAMLGKAFTLLGKLGEIPELNNKKVEISKINELINEIKTNPENGISLHDLNTHYKLLDPIMGDETLLLTLKNIAWKNIKNISLKQLEDRTNPVPEFEEEVGKNLIALSLLEGIIERKLYKQLISIDVNFFIKAFSDNVSAAEKHVEKNIIPKYRKLNPNEKSSEKDILEQIMCDKAEFPVGSILTYVPERKPQVKGIETGALRYGKAETLGDHELMKDELKISNQKYANLWHFLVYIHPDYFSDSLKLSSMVDTFLHEILPSSQYSQIETKISDICYFPYIKAKLRGAARQFEKMLGEKMTYSTLTSLYNAEMHYHNCEESSDTLELAEMAYIFHELRGIQGIEIGYDKPGDLKSEVELGMPQLQGNFNFDGKSEDQEQIQLERITTALKTIVIEIKKNNKK